MTEGQFAAQMARLSETFGKAAYGNERVRLIWKEVRDLPDPWFQKQVDDWIGGLRTAPLLPEIRTSISIERERSWGRQKANHKEDARAAYKFLNSGESGMFFSTVRNRIKGNVPDDDWGKFMGLLKSMPEEE